MRVLSLGESSRASAFSFFLLTGTDVDNAVSVRVLGQSLGNASLAATESAGATTHSWEEGIKNTLIGEERIFCS
jgi:hypothetical protein